MHRLSVSGTALLVALSATALVPLTASVATAAPAGLHDDFNGDGYADLAVSAPLAKVDGKSKAGAVSVLYGSANGWKTANRTLVTQNSAGVTGVAEKGDMFGDHIATGDLDGDGYADLVVGDSGEQVGSSDDYGTITIVWGSATGLSGGTLITTLPTYHDQLGLGLATGDFDGDGSQDLAALSNGGTGLNLFRGPFTRAGAAASVKQINPGEVPESIVAGNVNGDAYTDLVGVGQSGDSGKTYGTYFKGSATSGLVKGKKLPGGYSAAIGDFDKDGYGDIAIGDGFEKADWNPDGRLGGAVSVTYGSSTGPSTTRAVQRITQSTSGVPGTSEKNDSLGWSVAAGDVTGDGYADLTAGAPGETISGRTQTGDFVLLRGSKHGLTGTGSKAFSQNTAGVPGTNEKYDQWASAVHLADSDGDGYADLAIGGFAEDSGAGSVWLFQSVTDKITAVPFTKVGGAAGLSYFGFGFNDSL